MFKAWWGSAHHLIGKDILKFHCVWWPAMCMAADIDPPAEIFVHGFLLMGGQKLGKTMIAAGVTGEGGKTRPLNATDVSPLALADDFGVDPLRYHLLRDVPLGSDGDFSYEGIVARYNADLANNLGNLVQRVHDGRALEMRGHRPRMRPGQRARRRGRQRAPGDRGGVGALGAARRARGDLASHRRGERPPRVRGTVENGARSRG